MGDWIDDLLQKGEGLPGIGDAIQQLRMVYDIWRNEPANPQPTRDQASNLDDLFHEAQQLRDQFNESLITLRQKWSGNEAQAYLGPQVTAFQIEHDMEPGTTGKGYRLWNLLDQTTALLDYNAAAHHAGGDKLQQIQEMHGELNTDFMFALGTLGTMLATAPFPGVDVITDSAGAAALTAEAGEAAEDAIQLSRFMKLLKTVEEVAQVTKTYLPLIQMFAKATAIATIATVDLLALAYDLSNASSGDNNTLNPPIVPLPGPDLEQLSREFPDVLPNDIAALLEAGFSPDEIRAILRAGFTHAQIMALVGRIRLAQQNGTDLLGLTAEQIRQLALNIAAICNYSDPDHPNQEEQTREVGKIARELIGVVVAVEKPIYNPATGELLTRIDIETAHARIEVTLGSARGKLTQLLNYKVDNPENKQVILYVTGDISPRFVQQLEKDYGIHVVRSLPELLEYLKSLGGTI